MVLFAIFALNQPLRFYFHAVELTFAGLYLIALVPPPEILAFFLANSALEQLLLLRHKYSLHAECPLLLLDLLLP